MQTVGIRDLKQNASEVVARANEAQELIEITVRGQQAGTIVPAHGYRIVRLPDPVHGDALMARLAGRSQMDEVTFEAWLADLAAVRAAAAPNLP